MARALRCSAVGLWGLGLTLNSAILAESVPAARERNHHPGESIMTKSRDSKKEVKKTPAKTLKEKKAVKKDKKLAKQTQGSLAR